MYVLECRQKKLRKLNIRYDSNMSLAKDDSLITIPGVRVEDESKDVMVVESDEGGRGSALERRGTAATQQSYEVGRARLTTRRRR